MRENRVSVSRLIFTRTFTVSDHGPEQEALQHSPHQQQCSRCWRHDDDVSSRSEEDQDQDQWSNSDHGQQWSRVPWPVFLQPQLSEISIQHVRGRKTFVRYHKGETSRYVSCLASSLVYKILWTIINIPETSSPITLLIFRNDFSPLNSDALLNLQDIILTELRGDCHVIDQHFRSCWASVLPVPESVSATPMILCTEVLMQGWVNKVTKCGCIINNNNSSRAQQMVSEENFRQKCLRNKASWHWFN